MGKHRWIRSHKNDGDDNNFQHEETTIVEMDTPEQYMVTIEVEDPETGDEVDVCLIVPKESINHMTHILALNGAPFKVEGV